MQEFALCAQWVELYPVSDELKLQLKTEHLLHLLEKGQTDEAFQVQTHSTSLRFRLKSVQLNIDKLITDLPGITYLIPELTLIGTTYAPLCNST